MNLNQLRHFVVLSEELNFRQAARRLKIGASPLSQSIQRLEAALQAQLFDRTRRDVRLTPAGVALQPEARRIFQYVELAKRIVVIAEDPLACDIVLGFTSDEAGASIPSIVEALRRRCPAPIVLRAVPAEALLEGLRGGEIDVGLVQPPAGVLDDVEHRLIERSRLVAAVPSAWPAADLKQLTLRDLGGLPLTLFPAASQPELHARILQAFAAARSNPTFLQEAASVELRLRLAAAGVAASLVPVNAALRNLQGVTLRLVTDLSVDVQADLALAWHRDAPEARRDLFVEVVDELSWLSRQI